MQKEWLKNLIEKQRDERMGETRTNYLGLPMTITGYINANDIQVTFESGYVVQHTRYELFIKGSIKDKLFPEVYGVGKYGDGKYSAETNGKIYQVWTAILKRCYSKQEHEKKRSMAYIDCNVCDEWLNFQNFATWYEENYYDIPGQRMCVDKDLLVKNNKTYGPKYSCIVPMEINNAIMLGRSNKKNETPIGVTISKNKYKKYLATIQTKGDIKHCKSFETANEAFLYYKDHKERHIKFLAEKYKDYLPKKVYDALYAYKIEITD